MFSGPRTGAGRRTRSSVLKLLALCGIAAGASLAAAGPASAACSFPSCLTFHNVVMNTEGLGGVAVVTPSGTPLQVDVAITGESGSNITYQVTGWSFPTYSFSTPAPGNLTINPNPSTTSTGTLNTATGAATLATDLQADVTITGLGSCTVDTGPITLSTANTQPLLSEDFAGGEPGIASGAGALGVGWSTLTNYSGNACAIISADLGGPGGVWISGTITPPLVKVTHSKVKTVKAKKSESIKATLTNSGNDGTGVEKVCLKAPKGIKGSACKTITTVAGGKSSTVTFKVKATKKKSKKYTLKLTTTPTATALLPAGGASKIKPVKLTLKVKK